MPRRRIPWSIALGAALVVCAAAPATARGHVLDADGSVVVPTVAPVTRILRPLQGCRVLLDAGRGDCSVVRTAHGNLVVTVEPGPRIDDVLATRPWTVRVYRPAAGVRDGWQVALETRAEPSDGGVEYSGPLYSTVTAKAADVTRDGHDELILGYRSEGTGMILDVDVVATGVDGQPVVLAHDQLYKGNVVFRDGRLVAFVPVYDKTDANCCPKWIERDVLRYRNGALHVDVGPRVRTGEVDVPASELG